MTSTPYNPISGTVYQGRNVGALMSASDCLEWATFLQWRGAGYNIIKGSHGTGIMTFVDFTKRDKVTGKSEDKKAPRCYTVFNRNQVEQATPV